MTDEINLDDWRSSMRHFLLHAIIDARVHVKKTEKRLDALETFVKEEFTEDRLNACLEKGSDKHKTGS